MNKESRLWRSNIATRNGSINRTFCACAVARAGLIIKKVSGQMTKTFSQMSEAERQANRQRIARGWPADWEADDSGKQTPESSARDAARAAEVKKKELQKIARQFGFTLKDS
ncbi:hypothetical protein [Acidiphilium sp.]|uniref:hypothetical protein n=1 Tax=Acidiphilium sp. TaxID=527 RepID=UPI00258C7264|nr:hypothetical protein [Acidiphilium sp.]